MKQQVLKLKRLGIDTQQENVVYLRHDSEICKSEGYEKQTRIQVHFNSRSLVATINVVRDGLLKDHEVGLSECAWCRLDASEEGVVQLSHLPPLDSMRHVRSKIYGNAFTRDGLDEILHDIVAGKYSNIHLAAFVTAAAGNRLNIDEICALTETMISLGDRLDWGRTPIVDKHCVGGLPGNRTTLIVTPIVAAFGLTMPKTSSRAITSPAGTADTMETLAPVNLSLSQMRTAVEKVGACIVWGGYVRLSPADDILIKVERVLDFDSEAQLIASVLSKKVAAGSTHVLIDLPVGPTAKIRSHEAARLLSERMQAVASRVGLRLYPFISEGSQPVGYGVGPALEAHDVLAVLQNQARAPQDLKNRSLEIAARILEISGGVAVGQGLTVATQILESGQAFQKFLAICDAQGGLRTPGLARFTHEVLATRAGVVQQVDNRRLAQVAKLAGAPQDASAGLVWQTRLGAKVSVGEPLFTIHAESQGKLEYALEYVKQPNHIIQISEDAS